MRNYLGSRLIMAHIDQYIQGIVPGGNTAMIAFFNRHHIRPADVVTALEVTGRGDADTVKNYVAEHPEFQDWYNNAPKLA